MRTRNPKDTYAGLLFVLFGAAAMVFSVGYKIGTAAKMGPGYFPFVLGAILCALGIVIGLRSLFWEKEVKNGPSLHWKPLVLVLFSVVLFGLFLRPLGLLLSTLFMIMVSSAASHEFRLKESLLNAGALAFIVLMVFVYFLEFQVPVWPSILVSRT
jgi:hypothetical protein